MRLSRDRDPMSKQPQSGVGGVTLDLCPVLGILEWGWGGRVSCLEPLETSADPSRQIHAPVLNHLIARRAN